MIKLPTPGSTVALARAKALLDAHFTPLASPSAFADHESPPDVPPTSVRSLSLLAILL